jgi:PKD repeat protein
LKTKPAPALFRITNKYKDSKVYGMHFETVFSKYKYQQPMKRFLLIIPALVLIFSACRRDPSADFIVSSHQVEVYETVYFTNTSSDNAGYCEWDFGDGTISNSINASHYYETAGHYTVTLTLYDHSRIVSQASTTIEVMTTALTVIVKEYGNEHSVSNASVILYPTQDDWDFQTNAIVEGTTDADGVVRFENLNPVIYYIDVWHENYNNYQLAAEDVGWIMTDPLLRNGENEFVAYVDYVGTLSRAEGKKMSLFTVKKSEPRIKGIAK